MFEHKQMRNRELAAEFKRRLSGAFTSGNYQTREGLIDQMLRESRPKYDVSYDYAVRVMYAMVRDGKPCPARRSNKQAMWEEIRRHVERVMDKRRCSIPEAVATVLAEQKASRYFLSYKQASKIIYHEKHNRRRAYSA